MISERNTNSLAAICSRFRGDLGKKVLNTIQNWIPVHSGHCVVRCTRREHCRSGCVDRDGVGNGG